MKKLVFAFTMLCTASLFAYGFTGIDWLIVSDSDGITVIDDGDRDCITLLEVNDDGSFETSYHGDC